MTKIIEWVRGKKSWAALALGAAVFIGGDVGWLSPGQVESGLQIAGLLFGAGLTAKAARILKALK